MMLIMELDEDVGVVTEGVAVDTPAAAAAVVDRGGTLADIGA